jgi:signal transduction histidine kinase
MLSAVTMQVPIVFFLVVVTFQAARAFRERPFSLIGIGWLFNFLSIAMRKYLPDYSISFQEYIAVYPRELLVSLGSAFFLIGARSLPGLKHPSFIRPLSDRAIFALAFLTATVYSTISSTFPANNKIYSVLSVFPVVIIDIIALFALSVFFQGFYKSHLSDEKHGYRFLYLSTVAYCAIQPLKIFLKISDPGIANDVESLGFSLGLITKLGISFGMVGLLAAATTKAREDGARLQSSKRTIERIAHELGTPISEMILHVQELRAESSKRGRFVGITADLENALYRVRAIMHAAKQEPMLDGTLASGVYEGGPQKKSRELVVSANTLVQTAVMALKSTRDEDVIYHYNYAANCCLLCNPAEIVQVLINILRNSYDAFPRGEGAIYITTSTEKKDSSANGDREVHIEVVDNGEGVTEEIGRGFGLAVVRDLVQKNRGSIALERAAHRQSRTFQTGTRVVLSFPWVACSGEA